MSHHIAVVMLAAAMFGQSLPVQADDAKVQCLLVGTWTRDEDLENGARAASTKTLTASGHFEQSGTLLLAPSARPIQMSFAGTWKVESGRILYTLESSSGFVFSAKGSVSSDRIVDVDDQSFTFIDDRGIKHVEKRVSEPNAQCSR